MIFQEPLESKTIKEDEESYLISFDLDKYRSILDTFLITALDISSEQELTSETEDQLLNSLLQIISPYQEQPTLLDPYLERIITPLLFPFQNILHIQYAAGDNTIRHALTSKRSKRIFYLLYYYTKIRGAKTIIKFMPNDVSNLEPLLYILSIIPKDNEYWQIRYILLLWLSLVVMAPFSLETIDSVIPSPNMNTKTLVDKLIEISEHFLEYTTRESEAASILLSRILTRRDTVLIYLPKFLSMTLKVLESPTSFSIFRITGYINAFARIFKIAERQFVLKVLNGTNITMRVMNCLSIIYQNSTFTSSSMIRKLSMKLFQRIALIGLKPRIAKWRYNVGHRSLIENLKKATLSTSIQVVTVDTNQDEEEEEEYEIETLDEVANAIDLLLTGLQDKDTIVRWSAAKGIGRICQRLPKDMADQVISTTIDLFEKDTFMIEKSESASLENTQSLEISAVSDSTWHGVCLAIAELARRGLLLPHRLNEVMPWVLRSLTFDLKRQNHSIGAHVRDAACYVCWAFARAYQADLLRPFHLDLAYQLVVVTCFDREVNVRRAASAAFQECVGRLGFFPHGIQVTTTADFFSVGIRSHAFLKVAVKIAHLDEYRSALMKHLVEITLRHWDKNMRSLAAQTLKQIAPLDCKQILRDFGDKLVQSSSSSDFNTRHGALLGLGALISSIVETNALLYFNEFAELNNKILSVPGSLSKSCFKSFGSDLVYEATCFLIRDLCLVLKHAKIHKISMQKTINTQLWTEIIREACSRKEDHVQDAGAEAVSSMTGLTDLSLETLSEIEFFVTKINPSSDKFERRGYAKALGAIDWSICDDRKNILGKVVDGLQLAMQVQAGKYNLHNDAEARRCASLALKRIVTKWAKISDLLSKDQLEGILKSFILGLQDYSTDSRGDVGSFLREACMLGIGIMVQLSRDDEWLDEDIYHDIIGCLLKQSVERIDKMRTIAGNQLQIVINSASFTPSNGDLIQTSLFSTPLSWNIPSQVYPRIVPLLTIKVYRRSLLSGLVLSVGGISESLISSAATALLDYANTLPVDEENSTYELKEFAQDLIRILNKEVKNDRVIIPTLQVLDQLFEAQILNKLDGYWSFAEMYNTVIKEAQGCRDVKKLMIIGRILIGFASLPNDDVHRRALVQLLSYLVHSFPRVRSATAEQIYLYLSTREDSQESNIMEACEILSNTEWTTLRIEELKSIRDKLYPLLQISKPIFRKTKSGGGA